MTSVSCAPAAPAAVADAASGPLAAGRGAPTEELRPATAAAAGGATAAAGSPRPDEDPRSFAATLADAGPADTAAGPPPPKDPLPAATGGRRAGRRGGSEPPSGGSNLPGPLPLPLAGVAANPVAAALATVAAASASLASAVSTLAASAATPTAPATPGAAAATERSARAASESGGAKPAAEPPAATDGARSAVATGEGPLADLLVAVAQTAPAVPVAAGPQANGVVAAPSPDARGTLSALTLEVFGTSAPRGAGEIPMPAMTGAPAAPAVTGAPAAASAPATVAVAAIAETALPPAALVAGPPARPSTRATVVPGTSEVAPAQLSSEAPPVIAAVHRAVTAAVAVEPKATLASATVDTGAALAATLAPAQAQAGAAASAAAQPAAQAGTAAVAVNVQAPVGSAEFQQQLGERVGLLAAQNIGSAQIRLSPPHLGPLEIRISLADGAATVAFTTHSHVTGAALEAAAPRLRELLGAQGFTSVSVDVSQQSFSDRSRQPGGYEPDFAFAPGVAPAASGGAGARRTTGSARLDAYA